MSIDKITKKEWDEATRELASERQVGGDHYTNGAQPINYIIKNQISWCLGNAIKYITRSGKKGETEDHIRDLKKAIHYIELELQHTYAVDPIGNPIDSLDIDCDAIDYEMFLQEQYDFYVKQNVGENILKYDEWLIENEENLKEEFVEYGKQV